MQWFEDESFWRDFAPVMFPESSFESAIQDAAHISTLTGIQSGAVLDLCCGPGRHSIAFANRGFHVTGVDRTEILLERARNRAAGLHIEWVREDMRQFRRSASFDLALNLFTSFGYFQMEAEERTVLENLQESLRPGGVLVMDLFGKELFARQYQPALISESADGATWIQRPQVTEDWTRVENHWWLIKGGEIREATLTHFLYSGRELKDRLLAAGFASVTLFGGLDGTPYGLNSRRLVAVAKKA